MLRLLLPLTASLVLFACGTPCSHIAGAEQVASDKGQACNATGGTWSQDRLTTCEQNLSKCTQDDMKKMDTYADCLQKLPVCAEGQGLSWGLQRLACAESLTLSRDCLISAL